MAYYYVKNGGTATGDAGRYASQQTGSFAALGVAGYYNDIQDAIDNSTTSPVSGDFINVSDLHSFTSGTNILFTGVNSIPFFIVTVDDANMDLARTSGNRASEVTGSAADATFNDITMSGVELTVGDDTFYQGKIILLDCKVSVSGGFDSPLTINSDGASANLINTELAMNTSGNVVVVNNSGLITMTGGAITSTATITNLTTQGFTNGGGSIYFGGVDLSSVVGTVIANVGADEVTDDLIDVNFDMCKIASGVAFTNETFKSYNQRALFTRCSDSSAAVEYQYHLHAFGGDVDDDSAIYRNEDPAFEDSGQKISYKIVTNSDASLGSPLWLDFPNNRWAALSAGASDTLRIYLTSNDVLTDKDIYIEVSYPDGTNKQTPNFISSAPTTVGGTLDLMATGTTLTTDGTSTYTGGLTNKYQIDVDTSGDVGADTVPIVKVYITKPSTTIQISSIFELV